MLNDDKNLMNLIESVGNEPTGQNGNNNPNWFQQNNIFEEPINAAKKKKPGCKSGKCGKNTWAIVVLSLIAILLMFAGHGLFEVLGL